jgi:DNA-binding NarL/FixJ family response regulator
MNVEPGLPALAPAPAPAPVSDALRNLVEAVRAYRRPLAGTQASEDLLVAALAQAECYLAGAHHMPDQQVRALEARATMREQSSARARAQLQLLTDRDLQLLSLAAQGMSLEDIGLTMGTTAHSVENRLTIVRRRCGAANQVQAGAWLAHAGMA